jgi:uncharacterized protein (DUF2237 family)
VGRVKQATLLVWRQSSRTVCGRKTSECLPYSRCAGVDLSPAFLGSRDARLRPTSIRRLCDTVINLGLYLRRGTRAQVVTRRRRARALSQRRCDESRVAGRHRGGRQRAVCARAHSTWMKECLCAERTAEADEMRRWGKREMERDGDGDGRRRWGR